MSDERKAGVGDAAVRKATGRGWDEWFGFLDAAGAMGKSHKEIVALLPDPPEVSPWWRQQVTVAYERERGLRALHEKPGGFEIGRSKTVAVSAGRAYAAFADGPKRDAWLEVEGLVVRTAREDHSIRFDWPDGRTIVAVRLTAKGSDKTQVAVRHEKLTDGAEAEEKKAFWAEALVRLKGALETDEAG